MLPPYAEDVRNRAISLVLDEGKSYKIAGEIVGKEFGVTAPSKSTVYNWVKLEKKKQKKTEEPAEETTPSEPNEQKEPEAPVKESNETVETVKQKIEVPSKRDVISSVETVKKDLNTNLPVVTPQEVAGSIQGNISQVPPGTMVAQPVTPEEPKEKPVKKGFLDRVRDLTAGTSHMWIYMALLAGFTFAVMAGYKLASRHKEKEPEPVEAVEEGKEPESEEKKPAYYNKATGVLITDLER